MDKFNKAGESVDSILGSISSSVSTLESIEKQYDEVRIAILKFRIGVWNHECAPRRVRSVH